MTPRILLVLLSLLLSCSLCHSQEISEAYVTSDTLQVYFQQDKIQLEPQFRDNGKRLLEFSRLFHKLLYEPQNKVRSILIVSGASPEGASDRNRYLSDNRAKVVYDYLVNHHLADPSHIEIESRGVDWNGLAARVKASNLPYKEEVLQILELPEWIKKDGKVVDGRKHRLMNYQGGRVWKELYDMYFADLRGTRVMIAYNILKQDVAVKRDTVYLPQPPAPQPSQAPQVQNIEINIFYMGNRDTVYVQMPDTVVHEVPRSVIPDHVVPFRERKAPRDSSAFRMVLKTNLIYDAAVIPNIGAEVGIGKGFAISGNYQNIWLRNGARTRWYRVEGFEVGLKWYLNREKYSFRGHHVELYGQMLTWDITYKGRGYLAERWAYGGGIGYGYAFPIGRRLNLDFEIGVGYLGGNMHEYIPMDRHRVWQSCEPFHWIGPTKLGITLQWLLGRGNNYERRVKER